MDYKKMQVDPLANTRDVKALEIKADNVYEMVMIIAKRANQISLEIKDELQHKIKEVSSVIDNLEEVFENREQIELAKFYETLPKATLIAMHEYMDDKVYFRADTQEEEL
ncbi:MAG: DNA-directed RNA polymerase subunit omega [Bacteroidales bacterium]|nr:DNA-directed RNA polymerase subunit omega [Bacteroidales bacterium]